MNILYVYSSLADKGPTKQLLYLTHFLKENKLANPIVLTLSPEGANSIASQFNEHGISWTSLNLTRFEGLFMAKSKLEKFLVKNKFDVIHSHGIRPDWLVSSLQTNVPHITTIRNIPWIDYPMKFNVCVGSLMAFMHIYILNKCKTKVACSSSIQNALTPLLSPLHMVRNGVQIRPEQDKAELRKKLNIPQDKKVLIWVGSLISRKNLNDLLTAFHGLEKKDKLLLVILGDGPEKKTIPEDEKIMALGHVNNVREWLTASDVFISTSMSEGLPNSVLEALSHRLPCILSNIPPHVELQEMGKNLFYYPLYNTNALKEMIENLPEVQTFDTTSISSDRMAMDYYRLYQKELKSLC